MSKREKHNKYMREKIECECGIIVSRVNLSRHRQSIQHNEILDTDLYKEMIERKYDKKIKRLEKEKREELKKVNKEIEEYMMNNI